MSQNTLLFLSDIHIGTNGSTNWYQRGLHEELLLAIFEHAKSNADRIAEVIILGDLVDLWTYLPSVKPPSFEEVAAANPAIFSPSGAIAELARAMPKRVTYMPGNHDMGVTAEALSAVTGETIIGAGGILYEPEAGRKQVVCCHGHIYSLFNAPAPENIEPTGLPLGHFITRLAAQSAARKLAEGQTVADLPGNGSPPTTSLIGDAFDAFFQLFKSRVHRDNLGSMTIQTLLDSLSEPDSLSFIMPDGSSRTAHWVMNTYGSIFEQYGGGATAAMIYGDIAADFALDESDAENDLSHFASILSKRHAAVVMGHTHVPVNKSGTNIDLNDYIYVNSGFDCPAKPDMIKQNAIGRATFVELEIDSDRGHINSRVLEAALENGAVKIVASPLGNVQIPLRKS